MAVYNLVNDFDDPTGDAMLEGGEILPKLPLTERQFFEEAAGPSW